MPKKKITELDALKVVLEGMTKAMCLLNQTGAECQSAHAKGYLAEPKAALNNAIAKVNDQIGKANFFSQEAKE